MSVRRSIRRRGAVRDHRSPNGEVPNVRMAKPLSRSILLAGASALALALVLAEPHTAYARQPGVPLQGGSPVSDATSAVGISAQQAAAATQRSMQSLTRATQALQAMQAMQNAARNAALAGPNNLGADPNHPGQLLPNVPNGLAPGGLQVAPGIGSDPTLWQNANLPTQSSSNGQTVVTIQQTAQKAILTWNSFNVGKNTIAYFNQSAGTAADGSNGWVALNRVNDPSGVPSQILGQIRAEGSVYLLNRNGIIFGGSSQVNTNTFIASSLDLFSNDLATSNNRFLTGGIGDLNSSNVATNSILFAPTAGAGDVSIASGAAITVDNQGFAVIAAPDVRNSGVISAPGGQVALIAGIGVSYDYNSTSLSGGGVTGIQPGTNDNSTTNLRFANYGQLLDANGNDITPVGSLVNDGMIFTPRGNITMLGGAIQQNGVAIATTSVAQPGSIVISSLYEVGRGITPADESSNNFYTGSVAFGPQAVTAILADNNSNTLSSDATSLAPFQSLPGQATFTTPLPTRGPGLIEISGQAIDFQGGTLVYAPGQTLSANVTVLADPRSSVPAVAGSGRILLESGAILDVSGIPGTVLSVADNLLTVKLGGNELADSPLQQDGFLFGATVTVDMGASGINPETGEPWVGTPLANLASYANLVQRSIGQLLVNGGSVYLSANEVVGAPGSIINLMGGYIDYQGGNIATSVVIGSDGRKYNIGAANPDLTTIAVAGQFMVDHAHWGIVEVYSNPLIAGGYFQPEYIQGGNAGLLSVMVSAGAANSNSGAAILQSTLFANALAGQRQVAGGTLPNGGTFNFFGVVPVEIGDPGTETPTALAAAALPSNFTANSPLLAVPGSSFATVSTLSSQMLDDADFRTITIGTGGAASMPAAGITVDAGTDLVVQPGGSINLNGGSAVINGMLTARAGAINITTSPITTAGVQVPGDIVIGSSAVLDVSGFFVNDTLLPPDQQGLPVLVNAGSIALVANAATTRDNNNNPIPDLTGNITLVSGSLLDLEGGGRVSAKQLLQTGSNGAPLGSGGSLTLATYNTVGTPPTSDGTTPLRGQLVIDGTIDALGFSGGGTLKLQTVALQIGGDPAITPSDATYFDATHWGNLGFSSFVLGSVLQSEIPDGALVQLSHQNLLPNYPAISSAPTGADPAKYATVGFLTGTLRSPTNLSISAGLEESVNGQRFTPDGQDDATVGQGAQIQGDPGAAISISSVATTIVLGGISAPGGTISLAVNYPSGAGGAGPLGPLYLGPQSVLDVSGTAVINPLATPISLRNGIVTPFTGQILAGGTINLTDDWSAILVAPGAVLNVSGAASAFDVAQLTSSGRMGGQNIVLNRELVWSDAGQVNIAGNTGLVFEGTLQGSGGSAEAAGATLTVTGDTLSSIGRGSSLILVQDTAAAVAATAQNFDFATFVPTLNSFNAQAVDPNIPAGVLLIGASSLAG